MRKGQGLAGTKRRTTARSLHIEHQNLDEKIYVQLKAMLADGDFEPGQRIVQEDLASRMGVSRTPLVNALKRLAQDGLLEWTPRRGIYVRELSVIELVQLFEVRERLEPLAARLAATRISSAEVTNLIDQWQSMADAPQSPEMIRHFIEHDRHMHWRLIELAGNPYLTQAMAPLNMMAAIYLHGAPRPWEDTVPEHLALLEALHRNDPDASEEAMRRHIAGSLNALRHEAALERAQSL